MRILFAIPLLLLGACNVTKDGNAVTVSLPSLRVDAFTVGLAAQIQKARRTGLTVVVVVMVVLVGLARLVLHAHWPSDVLGGLLLGSSCAAAGAWWDARGQLA